MRNISSKLRKFRGMYWILAGILILIPATFILAETFFPGLFYSPEFLSVSLHSVDEADYRPDDSVFKVFPVGLSIIEEIIRDQKQNDQEIMLQLTKVAELLETPIVTITPYVLAFTATSSQPSTIDATSSSGAGEFTLTPTLSLSNISTQTLTITLLPTQTIHPGLSPTPSLTNIPGLFPTSTITITTTPEPSLTSTKTVVPTKTSTLVSYTPTPTVTKLPTQTFTHTPIPPTNTPIGCSAPNPSTGFVVAFNPSGSNIPYSTNQFSVKFNQPMDPTEVIKTDKYELKRANGGGIGIESVSYNSSTLTATIYFNNSDSDWIPGNLYLMKAKSGLKNNCGTKQDVDVSGSFTLENLCITSHPTNGYVSSFSPTGTGVSLSTNSFQVTFNQPMNGNEVMKKDRYELKRVGGGGVSIQSVSYNANTRKATIYFDINDSDWLAGTQYMMRVKDNLENLCYAKQGVDVDGYFTTENQ